MKKIIFLFFALLSFLWSFSQGTFYTVSGYNVCVYTPSSYNSNPTKKYPVIVFMPGAGEIGTDRNLLVKYGANAYVKQLGHSTFGGVEFIVVSFQQNKPYSRPANDKVFFDFLYSNFRVDRDNIFGTGLSRGWWHVGHYATYQKTATDYSYLSTFKGLCIYEGQAPDDRWDATAPYPARFGKWAKYNNGYLLAVHNRNSGFYADAVVKSVNDSVPNHAFYFEPLYGNGGHCCWDTHYGGNGVQPAKYNINGKQLNMYEFFASLVGTTTTPPPTPPTNPVREDSVSKRYHDSLLAVKNNAIEILQKEYEIKSNQLNVANANLAAANAELNAIKPEYERVVAILNKIIAQICDK